MKLRFAILLMFLFAVTITAQSKNQDSTDVAECSKKLQENNTHIIQLQSEMYEIQKKLDALYQDQNILKFAIKMKKELIEEKKKRK